MHLGELTGFPHEVDLGEEREGKPDTALVSEQLREGKVHEMRKHEKRHGGKGGNGSRKISFETC